MMKRKDDTADFVSKLLVYTMRRHFIKRDSKVAKAIEDGNRSPAVTDRIFADLPPKPCKYFCGRDGEVEALAKLIDENDKVFVTGIGGIGKSEVVRAYAHKYMRAYTNVLYITYTGNLRDDILRLDFVDDVNGEDMKERFTRHVRFLKSLREDSLIIIDNFNTTPAKEHLYADTMKYRCKVIFTTRSRFKDESCIEIKEIEEKNILVELVGRIFNDMSEYEEIVSQIIDLVHFHTFTVELAARLLQTGILSPEELLERLREENVKLQSSDNIAIKKDGKERRDTYYGHIHTLFSLYRLGEDELAIMRYMTFAPLAGIHGATFARIIGLTDMNLINSLIEMGFVKEMPNRFIGLHPIIHEIAITDTEPDTENCRNLLERLLDMFHHREKEFDQFPQLFALLEGIFKVIKVEDKRYYLSFNESAFLYTRDYRWFNGLKKIIRQMDNLMKDKFIVTDLDKAVLATFKAFMEYLEYNDFDAAGIEKRLAKQFENLSDTDRILLGTIYADIARIYARREGRLEEAEENLVKAREIFNEQGLVDPYETIAIECTQILILARRDKIEEAIALADKWKQEVAKKYSDRTRIYAMLEEASGLAKCYVKKAGLAKHDLQRAREIYMDIFNADPSLVERKDEEIQAMFMMSGFVIGEKVFGKRSELTKMLG